jgi:FixJ family two-component response regulator
MSIHVAANAAKESRPTLISIVDDDECVRDAMGALVRSFGYVSAIYSSAEDFLDSNRITETSCLITDLHMPGLTGIELHQRLLADGFAVPTVFITGLPDETTRTQVLAAGAIAFLSKPVGEKSLSYCLKTALIRRTS